jgi:hypothetical protein
MYKTIPLLLLLLISCNSKTDAPASSQSKFNVQPVQQKIPSAEIVAELDKLGFFSLTDSKDLNAEKSSIADAYDRLHFFEGTMSDSSTTFTDNRFYFIDCEELFEKGGLTHYLMMVKPTFNKLELKLDYKKETIEQTKDHLKETIVINGKEYTAFNGIFSDKDWGIAYVNFITLLNDVLTAQGSKEQFYPISCGNDGRMVLLTPEQFDFVQKHYPNDNEHPKQLQDWKTANGL